MSRRYILWSFLAALCGTSVPAHLDAGPPNGDPVAVWVFFRDKGPQPRKPAHILSDRSYERRARRGQIAVNEDDLPVYEPYLRRLSENAVRTRVVSRWLNAASVEATREQIERIARWPEVARVQPVLIGTRRPEPTGEPIPQPRPARPGIVIPSPEAYGPSLRQNKRIGVPVAHERGLNGAGVLICVVDAGFQNLGHEALVHLRPVATKDFVTGQAALTPDAHGSEVLSVLVGWSSGSLIGPAYGAQVALARTEIREKEVRVEEDYWIAAVEWADSLGVDIVATSLGYNTFDDSTANHTIAELDGSSLITRAADHAVEHGIVVVVAAGNERGAGASPAWQGRITLPADGFHVLAVGATDLNDALASFSSVGPTADGRVKPDVVAPGTEIVAADPSTPNGYRSTQGTSYATPLVAGAAAILLQAHPDWTPAEVDRALHWTAHDLGSPGPDNLYGWGIIDVSLALDAVTRDGLFGTVIALHRDPDGAERAIPVASARVGISGPASGLAVSDRLGRFGYSPLPSGSYLVACTAPGYEPVTISASIPQGEPITLTLAEREGGSRYLLTPNPARQGTGVTLGGGVHPALVISFYDVAGNLVRKLSPGEPFWDLTTQAGRPVAAGVYICRVQIDDLEVWHGKLAVLR